jgi:hypothetical protein
MLKGIGGVGLAWVGMLVLLTFTWNRLPVSEESWCRVAGCSGCGRVWVVVDRWKSYHGV